MNGVEKRVGDSDAAVGKESGSRWWSWVRKCIRHVSSHVGIYSLVGVLATVGALALGYFSLIRADVRQIVTGLHTELDETQNHLRDDLYKAESRLRDDLDRAEGRLGEDIESLESRMQSNHSEVITMIAELRGYLFESLSGDE